MERERSGGHDPYRNEDATTIFACLGRVVEHVPELTNPVLLAREDGALLALVPSPQTERGLRRTLGALLFQFLIDRKPFTA